MGYTHYWDRPPSVPEGVYAAAALDCGEVVRACRAEGILLAGPLGDGEPVVTFESVAFNGLRECGHPWDEGLGIVRPAEDASGIAGAFQDPVVGSWWGGAVLGARACPGRCSCETFRFDRTYVPLPRQEPTDGLYTWCCKTAFRPYDVAVTACLLVFRHHLGARAVAIRSDGGPAQWRDASDLLQRALGYGGAFPHAGEGE